MASPNPGELAELSDLNPGPTPGLGHSRIDHEDRGTQMEPEPLLAILADIGASVKDLKEKFGLFMKLAGADEVEERERARVEVRERDNEEQYDRHKSWATRRRPLSRSVGSTSYYSDGSVESGEGSGQAKEVGMDDAEARRKRRDARRRSPAISEDQAPSTARFRHVEVRTKRSAQKLGRGMKSRAHPRPQGSDYERVEVIEERSNEEYRYDRRRSSRSNEILHHLLRGYVTEPVPYGHFPDADLCEQLFGLVSLLHDGYGTELSSFLEAEGLVFPRDERCAFTFDTVALANSYSVSSAKDSLDAVDNFAKELREKGGFFFFRENYPDTEYNNKVYNGTHIFRCKDRNANALPMLSEGAKTFEGEFPKVEPIRHWPDPGEMRGEDNASARRALENMLHHERVNIMSNRSSGDCGSLLEQPPVMYHYGGKPRFDHTAGPPSNVVTDYGHGIAITHNEGRHRYRDPHLTAPWRRLCILTGLSRISIDDKSRVWLSMPLFEGDHPVDRGSSDRASNRSDETTENDSGDNASDDGTSIDLRNDTLLEHLSFEQISILKRSRKRVVKFQLSWYEIMPNEEAENRQHCGRLYRDDRKRSIQLQSFMAMGIWQEVDEDSTGDSKFWTLIIMAPAFFYHRKGVRDSFDGAVSKQSRKELYDLMAPLESVLPTLSATLLMVTRRILAHWTEISEYVEQFIASQDTFLHEKRHDKLLFDDDSFTRSRQYFWVISSTGEFIVMIDETIDHYTNVSEWVSPNDSSKHRIFLEKLVAIKDKFERQRDRATDLREGLFSASAVVESRLSTRLAQNVKLLTYVSIFYLPLAFCAALWAIPNITDASTRTPFIVAAVLIGFITYFIVFNLDALVSLGWETYARFRKIQIRQMRKDTKYFPADDIWQRRAKAYNSFQPDRGSTRPSEWYILLYSLRRVFGRSLKPEITRDDGSEVASSKNSWTTLSEASWSGGLPADVVSVDTPEAQGHYWRWWLLGRSRKLENGSNKA